MAMLLCSCCAHADSGLEPCLVNELSLVAASAAVYMEAGLCA